MKRGICHLVIIILCLIISPNIFASGSNDFFSDIKAIVSEWINGKSEAKSESSDKVSGKRVVKENTIKFSQKAIAQRSMVERRIYLIDLTKSMGGFNNSDNIFDIVKGQLSSAIAEINDTTTEIILIPFTDRPLDVIVNTIANKEELLDYINNLTTKHGDTNILDAWNKGVEYLDEKKINYLFMLTDGVHNYGSPIEELYRVLNSWHEHTKGKYEFAFYVLLTPRANEKEICQIVESSSQMWLVPTLNIKTDFIVGKMNLSVNIKKNNRVSLQLTCTNPKIFNDGFKFKLSIPENDYYKIIDASEIMDKDGKVSFTIEKLKPQMELPISYKTKLMVSYDKNKFPFVFFTPEEYNLNIANVGTRSMTVKKIKQ